MSLGSGEANAINAFVRYALAIPSRHHGPETDERALECAQLLIGSAYKKIMAGILPGEVEPAFHRYLSQRHELDAAVYELVTAAEQRHRGWAGFSEAWPIERLEATADAFRRHEGREMYQGDDAWPESDLRWWVQ